MEGKSKRKRRRNPCWERLRRNAFLLLLLLATVSGYVLGLLLRGHGLSSQASHLIGYPGQLVERGFMLVIVPLLFCSLVLGVSSLRTGGDARMVAITIGFFLSLSTFAAIMGATVGHVVHPGQRVDDGLAIQSQSHLSGRRGVILDSMLDLLWNAVPSNIIEATFTKEYTKVEILNMSDSLIGDNNTVVVYRKSMQKKSGVNFVGLLSFSILFGCALATLGDKGDALHQVIEQLNAVIMKMMHYFLNLLPIGLFFWMMQEGLATSAPDLLVKYLGWFLASAFGCIAFHQVVLLPCLYLLIVRKNPLPFHLNLFSAILTAFGTASSAATLPATVRCNEELNRLNRCVTRFVLPLGMVIHMNGGTFYLPLSAVFLAQLEGIELGTAETVIICLTAILLLISAPGTAAAGNPVYFLTVMAAAGIKRPQFLSLVISMEWLMERFRTVMNVVADSYVAAFVEKLCAKRLPLDPEDVQYSSAVLHGYNHTVDPTPPPKTICRSCSSNAEEV